MNYKVTSLHRPLFTDTEINNPLFSQSATWTVEVKQDGEWGFLVIQDGVGQVFSRAYEPRGATMVFPIPFNGVLAGEFMHASNWAIRHDCSEQFFAFDVLYIDCLSIGGMRLYERRKILAEIVLQLNHPQVNINVYFSAQPSAVLSLWTEFVIDGDYEGLVFKRADESYTQATWHRAKRHVTMDYICIGFTEGAGKFKGMLGAIQGGLYVNGVVKEITQVGGGFSDAQRREIWDNYRQYQGKVFTVRGWRLFDSGALRHPVFVQWREDKKIGECVWSPK